jgi:tetratricopeptide (TPR) repeat protein
MAAIEMAKSQDGLEAAVAEFKKATEIAPNMAAAWYNLGSVQTKTGELKEAITSYRRYLTLAPQADDARRVKDEIIKLEYRLEQTQKVKAWGGTWIAEDGTLFRLAVADSNRIMMGTKDYHVTPAEAESTLPISGEYPIATPIALKYSLELQGNRVTGSWHRAAYEADYCKIPEEAGELTGRCGPPVCGRGTRSSPLTARPSISFPPRMPSSSCEGNRGPRWRCRLSVGQRISFLSSRNSESPINP